MARGALGLTADVQYDWEIGVRLLDAVDDLFDVRAGKYVKVAWCQVAGPRVKDLHCLCAIVCLSERSVHTATSAPTRTQSRLHLLYISQLPPE